MQMAENADPDQPAHNVNLPRSGSKLFDTLMVFLKYFFEKVDLKKKKKKKKKKNPWMTKKHAKLPACQVKFSAEDR